ncbi:hypothetical protein KAR91_37235 [Candidatus Pacearchaeota archaeon]|nr:hypothetical protein [Candidatus Pacearchaeota archaeon]
MNKPVKEIMENIQEVLRKTMADSCDDKISGGTLHRRIMSTFGQIPGVEISAIVFEIKLGGDNGQYFFEPKNLYTFLIYKGFKVTYQEVKDLNEYETEIGTFSIKDGECYFKPIAPLVDTYGISPFRIFMDNLNVEKPLS